MIRKTNVYLFNKMYDQPFFSSSSSLLFFLFWVGDGGYIYIYNNISLISFKHTVMLVFWVFGGFMKEFSFAAIL